MLKSYVLSVIAVTVGSALVAVGFNLFLIPHHLLSGGVSGLAMIIGYFTKWNIAVMYFLLNVPILAWGWYILGRRFIVFSILSVASTTWMLGMIPAESVVTDAVLGSVFGGALAGVGIGITLRAGGSTGGFDIIGSILTRNRDFPLGSLLFVLNSVVVLSIGYLENWDLALYSMLSIFITGRIVDTIHIRHYKVTAFIVTNEPDRITERLLKIPRGVTVIKTRGAFTHGEKDMLMTVTSRYELADLKRIIKETDPKAFVNIVETVGVIGQFHRN